jgi:hypothetical protein
MRSRSCYVIEITVIPWLDAYVNIFQIVFPFLIIRQNAWHFMERNELFVAEFESIYELFIPNSPHRICMSIVSVSIASFLVAQFNFHPPLLFFVVRLWRHSKVPNGTMTRQISLDTLFNWPFMSSSLHTVNDDMNGDENNHVKKKQPPRLTWGTCKWGEERGRIII